MIGLFLTTREAEELPRLRAVLAICCSYLEGELGEEEWEFGEEEEGNELESCARTSSACRPLRCSHFS